MHHLLGSWLSLVQERQVHREACLELDLSLSLPRERRFLGPSLLFSLADLIIYTFIALSICMRSLTSLRGDIIKGHLWSLRSLGSPCKGADRHGEEGLVGFMAAVCASRCVRVLVHISMCQESEARQTGARPSSRPTRGMMTYSLPRDPMFYNFNNLSE